MRRYCRTACSRRQPPTPPGSAPLPVPAAGDEFWVVIKYLDMRRMRAWLWVDCPLTCHTERGWPTDVANLLSASGCPAPAAALIPRWTQGEHLGGKGTHVVENLNFSSVTSAPRSNRRHYYCDATLICAGFCHLCVLRPRLTNKVATPHCLGSQRLSRGVVVLLCPCTPGRQPRLLEILEIAVVLAAGRSWSHTMSIPCLSATGVQRGGPPTDASNSE